MKALQIAGDPGGEYGHEDVSLTGYIDVEVGMARSWGLSFGEVERMELERIMMDEDRDAALEFLGNVVYPRVKEAEKPGSCLHDTSKAVDDVGRPIGKHKRIGSFD